MKAILIVDIQGETIILEGTSVSVTTKLDFADIATISGSIERIPISMEPKYEVDFVGRKTTDKWLKQFLAEMSPSGKKTEQTNALLLSLGKRRFSL